MENLSIPRVALLLFAGALILSVAIGTTLFVMEREEQRLPPVAQPSPPIQELPPIPGARRLISGLGDNYFFDWFPDGNKIILTVSQGSTLTTPPTSIEMWSIGIDGTNLKRLTNETQRAGGPAMSPDGTKIAYVFSSTPNEKGLISDAFLMDADGSHKKQLTQGAYIRELLWSPDGEKILLMSRDRAHAFASDVEFTGFYLVHKDWTDPKRITEPEERAREATWTPDSRDLIYWSAGEERIKIINLDTGDKEAFIQPGYGEDFSWSPDGKTLLFSGYISGKTSGKIVVTDKHGIAPRELTDESMSARDLVWIMGGQRIAFVNWKQKPSEIWTMNPDGTDKRKLLFNYNHEFSLDGTKLAYRIPRAEAKFIADRGNLWIMDVDGVNNQQFTTDDSVQNFVWSPDGKHLLFNRELKDGKKEVWIIEVPKE